MNEIKHYIDKNNRNYFAEWRNQIRDIKAKIAVDRRLMRIELGNFGDHKPIREGVWELKIDVGQGYRIYYAKSGNTIVLLLCGGIKRTQSADIERACVYWRDWQQRDN
ncbi:type II toxin-antitoxin system RelE/ParE family toxin [Xenorhabdus szentirmaii]|uniref:Addiction module toxin n=1 Tax=Xenorhabdus szentirmaii DSM 16338 TaxID=1427518 RepID=W1IUZ0_9GAMM|nr:type II toxin-antitoxin system RelE/ParE family toxin [Xenorhabdus szentirmaii]PHM30555.1 addiction module protein [Xenorhabdus szentirmaii DSM 16338]CDL81020.1 Addiction module toxin [Xenorhabdus szentirmaii DSM 16338]